MRDGLRVAFLGFSSMLLLLPGSGQALEIRSGVDPKFPLAELKSFRFLGQPRAAQDSLADQPEIERKIRTGLQKELEAAGIGHSEADADFLIAFYAKSLMRSSSDSLGYADWGPSANLVAEPYEEGTLVVDLVSVRTNRVVWRGIAARPLRGKNMEQAIREACRKLVRQFRKDVRAREMVGRKRLTL